LEQLLSGYRRFRQEVWPAERQRFEALSADGQKPHTMVIACSDSRVDPATVFGTGPGELFAVRNVAGLVPPYQPDGGQHGVSAALEFAVRVLGVSQIVVLGHAQCGGVQAMVEGAPVLAKDFVEPWMQIARPCLHAPAPDGTEPLAHYEIEVVRLGLQNLMTFPWIREAAEAGRIGVHGFRFAIATGDLERVLPDRVERVA
jgi:carbonic anhydrase